MTLLSILQQITPLSVEAEQAVLASSKSEELPRQQLLLKQGEVCKNLHFIEKGLIRVFYNTETGKEITYHLMPENNFISILYSFYNQTPSNYSIETLEDSVIYTMPMTLFEETKASFPELEKVYSYVLREALIMAQERVVSLQFQSAQDRYNDLVSKQPSIIQRVPLGYIASYLGITQETLSRIRSKK
jgi:CRP-like cAMP-binding protein